MISKTHISGQKPRGRQINTKVCVNKSAIFVILSFFLSFLLRLLFKQRYLTNCVSTHRHFSTKLILITTRSSTNNRRLHSFNFTLVNKSHSQHSVPAVRCEGRHFLMLYACAHVVSFPYQIPRSLVWERDESRGKSRVDFWARSLPVAVDKVYEHHIGKVLHSAANL